MPSIFFPAAGVRALIAHAQASTGHRRLTFDQRFDQQIALPGQRPNEATFTGLTDEQIDWSKVSPHLHLAKDQGIYLMSDGLPQLPQDNPNRVIYADDYGKDADWEAVREVAGGDDFVVALPITHFALIENLAITYYRVGLNVRSITIEPVARKPRRR